MSVLISAIVSTYKSEEFIRECLTDLVNQSLFKQGKLEIVVVDSSSPQDEGQVVKEFQSQFPNIEYIRTSERETLYGAWNTGIRMAKGEFLTNANTDDRHHESALQRFAELLQSKPDIDLVYGNVFESNVANERFQDYTRGVQYQFSAFVPSDVVLRYQFGPQSVWRKSVHEAVGGFTPSFKAAGDYEFNFRFNLAGKKAFHLNETLGLFLNRPSSLSTGEPGNADEGAIVRGKYITPENILKLFQREGFPIETPSDQAKVFHSMALKASQFTLPWHPETIFSDRGVNLLCTQCAFQREESNDMYRNNFAISLALCGDSANALTLLENHSNPSLQHASMLVRENRLQELQFLDYHNLKAS